MCWTWQFGILFPRRRPICLEAQSASALNDVASSAVVSVYTSKDRTGSLCKAEAKEQKRNMRRENITKSLQPSSAFKPL